MMGHAARLFVIGVLAIACCRVSHAKSTAPKCTAQSLASDIWLFWAKWSVNGGTKPPMTPALFGCPNSSKAWKAALVIVAPKSQKPGSGSPAYKQEKALPEGCRLEQLAIKIRRFQVASWAAPKPNARSGVSPAMLGCPNTDAVTWQRASRMAGVLSQMERYP